MLRHVQFSLNANETQSTTRELKSSSRDLGPTLTTRHVSHDTLLGVLKGQNSDKFLCDLGIRLSPAAANVPPLQLPNHETLKMHERFACPIGTDEHPGVFFSAAAAKNIRGLKDDAGQEDVC
ncbi:hypothetical protein LTR78_000162 [Recurvomyces mirabilis]|uniref:Uncharacterized protein n=1 Tax=Recurvomyces mirabilis TaxID=574656 RepID=A0AAE0WXM4_9PEZI|nr:hypothetical protein LTR78_000162 [Recurvomyces mirabilis]KAK5161819.1 hypothetical protein LTS14_000164 [Recurvomyces mirabilis]